MPDPQSENPENEEGGTQQQDLPGESEEVREDDGEDDMTPLPTQPDVAEDDDPTEAAPTD